MKNIIIGEVSLQIQRNSRSKSIKLRLDKQGGAVLVLPKWTPESFGIKFAKANMDWIKEQQEKIGTAKQFEPNMEIELLGGKYTLVHNPHSKGGVCIQESAIIASGDRNFFHRRIRDFIKKQAYAYIQQKAIYMATELGEKPSKITLRDTSSRWGSCSSTKALSFCWKLALAPDYVLDYIIAHEVAHLKEMNHSDSFWHVVAQIDTHRASAQSWLRKHGTSLQTWM